MLNRFSKSISAKDCSRFVLQRLIFVAATLFWFQTASFAIRKERLIESWRPQHYDVQLTLNEQLTAITAARTDITITTLKRTNSLDLDFGDLEIDSVLLDSKPVQFLHQDGKLLIELNSAREPGSKVRVSVIYHGKPKDGLILTKDKDGRPSAVGDNWPDRVHHWIPSLDHPSAKASVTFNVTAPASNLVVANGRFSKVETTANGNRTWTYTEGAPIPPYCMIIGVGDFARLEPTKQALTPLSYYVPQSDLPFASKGFDPAGPVLKLFSETIAPYPYEKLALIVGATRFGGMENSSAIVFSNGLFNPNPNARLSKTYDIPMGTVGVVAHEIAHQWFGDSVTESTWADLWLSEGFATYFAGLFIETNESAEAFQSYMNEAAEAVFAYEKKTLIPIHDRDTQDLFELLNPNNYQKGAWVLHMLRIRLGDEAFFKGVKSYYQAHKESTASTADLRVALEKSSGKDLKQFFKRWVYESGHPQYQLSMNWNAKKRFVTLVLEQTQTGDPFLDPLPIRIDTAHGPQELIIIPNGKLARKELKLKSKPTGVKIDPNNTLLREAKAINE